MEYIFLKQKKLHTSPSENPSRMPNNNHQAAGNLPVAQNNEKNPTQGTVAR